MAIFYTDTASFNSLTVTGSTVMSASANNFALNLIGSGSTIFSVSGSGGGIFSINDITSSDSNLFSVSTGSTNIFSIDQSKNINVSGSIAVTGSLLLNASGIVTNSQTSSFVTNAQTGSFATTGSNNFNGNTTITGSLNVITGSSIEFQVTNTGVKIGNAITDNHTVTGSFNVSGSGTFRNGLTLTGSLSITGSLNVVGAGITGSLLGTASYALTASYVANDIITASVSSNTITFTKGNGTTFPITVATGSGGVAFPYSGSAQITGSLGVTGSLQLSGSSLKIDIPSKVNGYVLTTDASGNATWQSAGAGASFPYTGSAVISGSLIITGSTISTSGFTGSLQGTSSWATNAITASSADAFIIRGNLTVSGSTTIGDATTDSITMNAATMSLGSGTGILNIDSNTLVVNGSTNRVGINTTSPGSKLDVSGNDTTVNTAQFGTIGIQSYTVNNAWFGDNVYFNGTNFVRRATGYAGLFYFQGNEGQFRFASSNTSGSTITQGVGGNGVITLKTNLDGTFAVGSVSNASGVYTGANFIVNSSGSVGIGTTSPSAKLHVVDSTYFKVAHFEGTNGTPLQIWTSDESLEGGYDATQGSIGVGGNRLQIKYGGGSSTQWADAAYHLHVGGIDLNTAYNIQYPGVYEVTVGSATGGESIYLPAPNAWSSGFKVTIINATDESVNVNINGSGDRYLEGTTISISILSPRSIVEYVSNGTNWRMMPSMKQITYESLNIDSLIDPYPLYTKGVYHFSTVGVSSVGVSFPSPDIFSGETITIINPTADSFPVTGNVKDVDNTTVSVIVAQSSYQFTAIGSYWRLISRYNA